MDVGGRCFREVWLADFEFSALPGERPTPICLVAWELGSGRKQHVWQDELAHMSESPYRTGADCLFVAYYASAELGCHLALGWSLPSNVLDLYTEFRNATNGLPLPCGAGLLGALAWYGLSSIDAADKDCMRQLAMRGGPWTDSERQGLLDYCESDVAALARLLPMMTPHLNMPRALLRGRYMKAAAHIEHNGVPIDTYTLRMLRTHWDAIQDRLIARIDQDYGVFEGRSFKAARFAKWLVAHDIAWPRLESGALDLKDDTFRELARAHPKVAPLRELRVALSQMRLSELAVDQDGRNRCLLSAFSARTGRNQPSNSQFIFGPAVWLRSLIKPEPGHGIAYVDWSQQEVGIAAALSSDPLMQEAYVSGDPYLAFAKQAGAVLEDATQQSHKAEREQFKACVLAVQYGMGAESLAQRIGQPEVCARELLRLRRETYRVFWLWSDAAVDYAMLHGKLWTVFGWAVQTGTNPNPRFLRNFLMQANGAEMLRLACSMLVEAGIKVCAPVHDAVLIEAELTELEGAITTTQAIMSKASAIVLDGFRLRSGVEVFCYPDRYLDTRGARMWETMQRILGELQPGETCASSSTPPAHECNATCSSMRTRPILLSVLSKGS
jgi:DNA polymerase I